MDYKNEVICIQEDCEGFIYSVDWIVMFFCVNNQGMFKLLVMFGDSLCLSDVILDFGFFSGLLFDLEVVEEMFDFVGVDLFIVGVVGVGFYGVELDFIWFMFLKGFFIFCQDLILFDVWVCIWCKGGYLFGI